MRAKTISDILKESYEPKDLKRVKDFKEKSGGNFEKEISLARQMANSITNIDKAIGRAEAAAEVYGTRNEIVEIFYDKAKELGYQGPPPGERLKDGKIVLGSKLPKEGQYKKSYQHSYYSKGSPILPLGFVDIRSGNSKYFNVYETWGDKDTIVEVWRDNKGINTERLDAPKVVTSISHILKPKSQEEIEKAKRDFFNYRLIFTRGSHPLHEIGEKIDFIHVQSHSRLGRWEMVDYVPLKYMRELILPYGKKISGYVYK